MNRKEPDHDKYEEAIDWEASRVSMVEKSERRAWMVALVAVAIAGLSWLTIVFMMPLKETIPYVIRVDNTTGVPDIVTTMQDKRIGYDDVVDKYWVAQFVRARETYDWYTLQKDYNTVGLLTSPNVGKEYASLFEGADALDKKWGKSYRTTVEVVSVVPNGKGTATVRLIKTASRVDDANIKQTSKWIATVSYEYRNPSHMKESVRLINPFGFQVTSYRIDPELITNTESVK
ncbi:MAG: type IV secretion system protein [Candidatus Cloacimonetes bacterium]|nr:type IV secretion system protein [Candidatus Cloacimonadota bacterium]